MASSRDTASGSGRSILGALGAGVKGACFLPRPGSQRKFRDARPRTHRHRDGNNIRRRLPQATDRTPLGCPVRFQKRNHSVNPSSRATMTALQRKTTKAWESASASAWVSVWEWASEWV